MLRKRYQREPFMSIDPGADGCAIPWNVSGGDFPIVEPHAPVLLNKGSGADSVAIAARRFRIKVFVVEQPYVGKNVQTALRAAEAQGVVYGRIQSYVPVVIVIRVAPSSWQTILPCPKGMKRNRQWVSEQQIEVCDRLNWFRMHTQSMSEVKKEGVRASYLIGRWWGATVCSAQ